jgi:hypothetical protein
MIHWCSKIFHLARPDLALPEANPKGLSMIESVSQSPDILGSLRTEKA